MDERRALMAAIIANPDEDTPRLVFADWLQEHGDKHDQARAEFIRLQLAFAGAGDAATGRRADALRKRHVKHWVGDLANAGSLHKVEDFTFTRGLLRWWWTSAASFLKPAHQTAVCEWFPRVGIESLSFTTSTKKIPAVVASPALEWVSGVVWHDAHLEDVGVAALAESPRTARLSRLVLDKPWCTDTGLKAFAKSKGYPNLRAFGLLETLWRGDVTAAGVRLVLASDRFPKLEELDLSGAQPHAITHRTLFTSKELSRLRVLRMGFNTDLKALAKCKHLTGLEELHVADSALTDTDAFALADNPALPKLKVVHLTDMNGSHLLLGEAAEQALRDRFGAGLTLEYSVLCRRR